MSPRITISARARLDLLEHFVYIGQNNIDAARRFRAAAQRTFERLMDFPGLGTLRLSRRPELAGLRSLRIEGSANHLAFYIPEGDRIRIVRVLHGARDIEAILDRGEL